MLVFQITQLREFESPKCGLSSHVACTDEERAHIPLIVFEALNDFLHFMKGQVERHLAGRPNLLILIMALEFAMLAEFVGANGK